jgi:hypothetical protein
MSLPSRAKSPAKTPSRDANATAVPVPGRQPAGAARPPSSRGPTATRRSSPPPADSPPNRVPGVSRAPAPVPVTHEIPSRDANATPSCPVCGRGFHPDRVNQNYCSPGCRKQAWRRRHQTPIVPVLVPPKGRSRREVTVYECGSCGARAVGDQRCDDCGTWMGRVGPGGRCPNCDDPVAVSDLLDTGAMSAPVPQTNRETLTKPPRRPTVSVPAGRPDTTTRRQP